MSPATPDDARYICNLFLLLSAYLAQIGQVDKNPHLQNIYYVTILTETITTSCVCEGVCVCVCVCVT